MNITGINNSLSADLETDTVQKKISWKQEEELLAGLPGEKGVNIAYETIDRHCVEGKGEAIAIRWFGRNSVRKDLSYRSMMEMSNQMANVLKGLDIEKGDVVFSLLGRTPDLYITAIGTLKTGAIYCPLFSVFGPEPIFQRLSRGKGKILVTTSEIFNRKLKFGIDRLPELKYILITDSDNDLNKRVISLPKRMKVALKSYTIPPTSLNDPALLHFTSGTTGMPKGAVHLHKSILTHSVTGRLVLDLKPGDIYWCTADPGWVTGTSYGIITPLLHGVTIIADEEEFEADRWYRILEENHVQIWYTAPTAFRRLMRVTLHQSIKDRFPELRLILSVGEPLHPDAVIWGQKTFGVPVLDNWWQTETGGIMISNLKDMKVKPGSMGKPIPGIEAAVASTEQNFRLITEPNTTGMLVLKKGWPSMFSTYFGESLRYDKCFQGEWYMTGDLVQRDSEGYYWFVGRSDDMIKTSGHLVGPFEVERVLMEHGQVSEAAVIGKPDPMIGELIKGFVVLKPGAVAGDVLRSEIMAFARLHLGAAIAPRQIEFIQGLPKTRSGKILRRLLKARDLGLPEGDLSTLENG
jgi:acetyl-CoA synthetase